MQELPPEAAKQAAQQITSRLKPAEVDKQLVLRLRKIRNEPNRQTRIKNVWRQ